MTAREELAEIVGASNVLDDIGTLERYSRDESFVLPGMAWCVVKPKMTEEVRQIVKWANQHNEPLTPISSPGGPRFHGDTLPSQGGVVADLSGMNKILTINSRDRLAMVEPGVTFGQLDAELGKHGLRSLKPLLPRRTKSVLTSYLEREPIVTPREQWDTTDPLICTEVIFGTGDVFRTGSAAQGSGTAEEHLKGGATFVSDLGPSQTNFSRVLQGAQGTLGIVTWASVMCGRLPAMQKAFFIPSDNLAPLVDLSYRLTRDRIGEELFILNGANLATIAGDGPESIRKLAADMPMWVLFLNLTAPAYFPEEKMSIQEREVADAAQALGLQLQPAVDGFSSAAFMKMLENPPDEYYKMKYKGACQDIFFVTTLDKTPGFVEAVRKELGGCRYPATDVGIYLQPRVQGCSCHCEFSFPYDPSDKAGKEILRTFLPTAARRLADSGAFFSRPYGPWADITYGMNAETTAALRKIKGIFDPRGVLNPGKLCY
jgi:FAD/FMN-containing dehydrogenase